MADGGHSDDLQMTVTLALAETGGELRRALETAQYGRIMVPPEPRGTAGSRVAAERRAIASFVDAFESGAEAWEELPEPQRSGAILGLSAALETLERHGLFVHWAAVSPTLRAGGRQVRLAVALIVIDRSGATTLEVTLPAELAAAGPEGQRGH